MLMTPDVYEKILVSLEHGAMPLSKVHALVIESGSNWSLSQVQLFLSCIDGVEIKASTDAELIVSRGQQNLEEQLIVAIMEIVKSQAGRPIPAAAIKKQLPKQFITSEEQIKALARKTPQLEVMGPGLIRLKI